EGSGARIRYKLSKQAAQIDVDVRIVNQEKRKMFNLGLTPSMKDYTPALEVAFGEEPMKRERENVGHKYLTVTSPDGARLSILNRGIYGSSWLGDTLYLTLLHSPGHTTHPIGDRPTLPSDRHADYMEQGERDFSIRLIAGEVSDADVARAALTFNETPMAVNVFPSGDGYDPDGIPAGRVPFLTLNKESSVTMTALKRCEDGQDCLLRLFNPTASEAAVTVKCPTLELCESLTLGRYEAATYRIREGKLLPCRMDEKL
ncbi:MAG: hypothetical protein IJX72_03660, partial [Clostridia bacterium]|nr:hypothetical protein [Clostridia bacterium]